MNQFRCFPFIIINFFIDKIINTIIGWNCTWKTNVLIKLLIWKIKFFLLFSYHYYYPVVFRRYVYPFRKKLFPTLCILLYWVVVPIKIRTKSIISNVPKELCPWWNCRYHAMHKFFISQKVLDLNFKIWTNCPNKHFPIVFRQFYASLSRWRCQRWCVVHFISSVVIWILTYYI